MSIRPRASQIPRVLVTLLLVSGAFLSACSIINPPPTPIPPTVPIARAVPTDTPNSGAPATTGAAPVTKAPAATGPAPTTAATTATQKAAPTQAPQPTSALPPMPKIKPLKMSSPEYGAQAFLWWRPETADRDVGLARDAGLTWVKQQFAWRDIEGAGKGKFDWSHPDQAVYTANSKGVDLLARLDNAPDWAAPGCFNAAN